MAGLGKLLVLFGAIIVGLGFLLMMFEKIPIIGKLPGDIHIKRESFEIYIPITTSLALSILLSGLFWLVSFLQKK